VVGAGWGASIDRAQGTEWTSDGESWLSFPAAISEDHIRPFEPPQATIR